VSSCGFGCRYLLDTDDCFDECRYVKRYQYAMPTSGGKVGALFMLFI
jgi:hypothetical protein